MQMARTRNNILVRAICIYEFFINKYRLRAYIVEIMLV